MSYIISVGDVDDTVWNLYFTLVEVVGCFNRLIINLSGAFFTIVVVDEQEEIGSEDDGGGDNRIISGEDGCWIGLSKSIRIWLSSNDFVFSSNSSSSTVSHRLASSSSLNEV